jgi:hypothetical protein
MEAITQLLTADPVSYERVELEKIKSAMKEKGEEHELGEEGSAATDDMECADMADTSTEEDVLVKDEKILESDEDAAAAIEEMDRKAASEAEKATVFSTDYDIPSSTIQSDDFYKKTDEIESDKAEDSVVERLKKRIETMVNKIEVQLSDVQVKIGDKLHFLDKDMDGILSREEMAECLQQVLKREITFEEAMEIASEMVSRLVGRVYA